MVNYKVLAYPKNMFTKEQVMREKNKFDYPKAWRYESRGLNHYLVLEGDLFEQHYVKKNNNDDVFGFGW